MNVAKSDQIEKGLATVQVKLMELINRNYGLRTKDGIAVHRDMTMRMIEINKLIERLLDGLRSSISRSVSRDHQFTTPTKRLVPMVSRESDNLQFTYSRDISAPKLAQRRHDSKLARSINCQNDKISTSPKSKTSRSPLPKDPELDVENFATSVSVVTENMNIAVKRGKALVTEYKKIDDNLYKLIKFFHGRQNKGLIDRYASALESSVHIELANKTLSIRNLEKKCKQEVIKSLKDTYEALRSEVNSIKNTTKHRRNMLTDMVQQDKLSVENIRATPKKLS